MTWPLEGWLRQVVKKPTIMIQTFDQMATPRMDIHIKKKKPFYGVEAAVSCIDEID